jgi:hypothetical protein
MRSKKVVHLAQAGKSFEEFVLGFPERVRGGAGCEDMQFISEGLGGAIGGGAVTVVVRDAYPVLAIVEVGGDAVGPCLGSEAE